MKTTLRWLAVASTLASAAVLAGCGHSPSSQTIGTAGGAVIGGVAGSAATGGSTLGTLGGAAVGGAIGNEAGRRRDERR